LATLELVCVALGLLIVVLALGWEAQGLSSQRDKVPLRIAVTGSRGKSTLVRLVVAALRTANVQVVAKTTGSAPRLHHVDGQEESIRRRGTPSLLEIKQALRLAGKEQAEVLVVELMSLQPENLFAESVRLLQPQFLLLTNVREDHLEQMGETRFQIAEALAAAIPLGSKVLLPEEEYYPVFKEVAQARQAEVIQVDQTWLEHFPQRELAALPSGVFFSQLRLLACLWKQLGLAEKMGLNFLRSYHADPGAPRLFQFKYGPSRTKWVAFNAFAANDPLSTRELMDQFKKQLPSEPEPWIGLLNLRADRGDRTWQWIKALQQNLFPEFERFYVLGRTAPAFCRHCRGAPGVSAIPLSLKKPPLVMNRLARDYPLGGQLIGVGNIGGLGKELLAFWSELNHHNS